MSYERIELDADEAELDRVLSAARPAALPIGFRDAVMARLGGGRPVMWEWIVAAASTDTTDAFFFVDGLTVIALALLGVACAFAAHALVVSAPDTRRLAR